MQLQEYTSLKGFNTFGINVRARYFAEITTVETLREALSLKGYPKVFVLGGGSNILLTADLDALVLHINIKGITVVSESDTSVHLRIMAGENWHNMVQWTLEHDFGGLENMSLIPGNTGTAPIQNIGAYGVELKDRFVCCEALEIATGKIRTFDKEACQFGYRDSFFKNEGRGKYIITAVTLELTKKPHVLNTSYGAIEKELMAHHGKPFTIQNVSKAVIAIRSSKLPDPEHLGNSGSFFKNPVLDKETFERFYRAHPQAPYYEVSETTFKVPAGWLIEQCGFKGRRYGDAGVHDKQALVLVNHGNAKGEEIWELAKKIMATVSRTFGISLTPEVNVLGNG